MTAGTKFYQQKLPAWRPNLSSASTTIPSMIVVGLVYICIGMAIHYTSNGVREAFFQHVVVIGAIPSLDAVDSDDRKVSVVQQCLFHVVDEVMLLFEGE